MAKIPESDILALLRAQVEEMSVEPLLLAALEYAGIARKPFYTPEETLKVGEAITIASVNMLREALGAQGLEST